jgi:hypothetical protein
MDEATYEAMPSSLILREARAGGFTLVSMFTNPRAVKKRELLKLLRAFDQNLRHCPRRQLASRRAILLAGIGQMTLPHRPGRVEPRAVKRRPKPHPLLMKTREEARQRLRAQQQRHIAASLP